MFLDASALCAMITNEEDAASLSAKLEVAETRLTSPLAVWETVTNVARLMSMENLWSQGIVERYLKDFRIEIIAVLPEMTFLALDAFRRYGKGRHRQHSISVTASPMPAPSTTRCPCSTRATTFH